MQEQPGDKTVLLRLSMRARETRLDWSTAEGQWDEIIPVNLPTNSVIKDIVSDPNASWEYTDTDRAYDESPQFDLGRFRVLGDTEEFDICNRTIDDSHMYFENIRFQLRVGVGPR